MAFTFYPGVQVPQNPGSDYASFPNEVPGTCVRTIFWVGRDSTTVIRDNVAAAKTAGKKFVIACIDVNNWGTLTLAAWKTAIQSIASQVSADVFEIANEPGVAPGSVAAVGGKYWDFLRAASDIIRTENPNALVSSGASLTTAATPMADNMNAETIVQDGYVDLFSVHRYFHLPADMINNTLTLRTHVNGFGAAWTNLPMIITEFGWSVYAPNPGGSGLLAGSTDGVHGNPGTATDTAADDTHAGRLYAAYSNWKTNRETLKLRAACWYVWQDIDGMKAVAGGYCGLKKLVSEPSASSPPSATFFPPALAPPSPTSRSNNGHRPAHTRLATWMTANTAAVGQPSYGIVDPPAAPDPPTVVTGITDLITETTATVHGTVNPNGVQTTVWFDYGTVSGSYPFVKPSVAGFVDGSGTSVVNISMNLTGLVAGQTYYYRIRAKSSAGPEVYGAEQAFATSSPPLPPTVITGSATAITGIRATLNGIIDPNAISTGGMITIAPATILDTTTILGSTTGVAGLTEWYFQWSTTSGAYDDQTTSEFISGTSAVSVSRTVTGLLPNRTYYYRLVGIEDPYGEIYGLEKSFSTVQPAADLEGPPALIPLQLSVEISTADGRIYRWDQDNDDERNNPFEISFATQAGDGFAEASCVLNRPIDFDWADLALLTRFRLIGADAAVAYEGRVAGMPRSVSADGDRIQVDAQGLMSSARDRVFTEVYVERSTEGWQEPTLNMRKTIMSNNNPLGVDVDSSVDTGSVHFKGTTSKTIPAGSQGTLVYIAPSGCKIASMQYRGFQTNVVDTAINRWEQPATLYTDDDTLGLTTWDSTGHNLGDLNLRTAAATTPRKFVALRLACVSQYSPAAAAPTHRRYDVVALYGAHGLPLRGPAADGTSTADPQGVYASDVITDLIDRFCPLLDSSQVASTDTVIANLSFTTPTTPFDAITLVNGYHLYLLAAWENGVVQWEPADLTAPDWQVRHDEWTQIDLQGDTTDQFANGIVVSYTDVDQRSQVLFPTDFEDLRDTDPDNPANKEGLELWTTLELSVPVDRNGALTLGQAALSEFNRPKAPGTITLNNGYIQDSNGNLNPGWRVRYGQTVVITDLPNDTPRLITATSWSEDGSLQITLEQPSSRLDAVVARLELGATTRGL